MHVIVVDPGDQYMVCVLDSNGQVWGNFDVNGGTWANLTANLAYLSGNPSTLQLYEPNPNSPGNFVLLAGGLGVWRPRHGAKIWLLVTLEAWLRTVLR